MGSLSIRSAGRDDEAVVVSVITLAFAADPMARWATPDPARYLAAMPQIARAFGGNGFAHDSVHVVEGGGGAAMWLPPGVEPDSERLGELIAEYGAAERLPEMGAVIERMEECHPREPHWYLPLIGVDPAMHGMGLGSALLRHALARFDAEGVAAYLESSNPRNIGLYERHGFVRQGVIQVGSSPPVVPMFRSPR